MAVTQAVKSPGGSLLPLRLALMSFGFLTMGLGTVMTLNAHLGVSCFNVLHLGLSYHFPITVGQATQIVGIFIIGAAVLLGIRPRLGTWLNMILVGASIDLVMWTGLVPLSESWFWRGALLLVGLALMTLGMCLYMCAGLGAGPRDGLMLGLTLRLQSRVGVVRGFLEAGAMVSGWLLGGPVGVGTLVSAFALGWFLEAWFSMLAWTRDSVPGMGFLQLPSAFMERLAKKGMGVPARETVQLAGSAARSNE